MYNQTQGLCGTFDNNQNNDLLTRQHNLEPNPNLFGNSWKTRSECPDLPAHVSVNMEFPVCDFIRFLGCSKFINRIQLRNKHTNVVWHKVLKVFKLVLQVPPNPCDTDPAQKQRATAMCDNLNSDVFVRKYFGALVHNLWIFRIFNKWSVYKNITMIFFFCTFAFRTKNTSSWFVIYTFWRGEGGDLGMGIMCFMFCEYSFECL